MRNGTTKKPMAVSSSLNSIHISPRTPRTPRTHLEAGDEDDVELELLNEEERVQSARHFGDDASISEEEDISKKPISPKDKRNMVLLCVLCKRLHCISTVSIGSYWVQIYCKGFQYVLFTLSCDATIITGGNS